MPFSLHRLALVWRIVWQASILDAASIALQVLEPAVTLIIKYLYWVRQNERRFILLSAACSVTSFPTSSINRDSPVTLSLAYVAGLNGNYVIVCATGNMNKRDMKTQISPETEQCSSVLHLISLGLKTCLGFGFTAVV